jgi:hypothetical protein
MKSLYKAAAAAAFLIVIGMLIHNFNALYYEPVHLGFVDKAKDYGDMAKIENAIWSWSFTSSGITHIVVGFAMMILGLAVSEAVKGAHPIAARLTYLAALVSGFGFLFTGVSDIPGTMYGEILRELNPDYNVTILLITTMIRSVVNITAIAGLSWFAGMVAWSTMRTGMFPKWFGRYGYVMVLPGIMSFIFPPAGFIYIQLTPIWMFALGVYLNRMAQEQ